MSDFHFEEDDAEEGRSFAFGDDNDNDAGPPSSPPPTSSPPPQDGANTTTDWIAYQDDEGRTYFHNSVTNETSWDEPAEGFRREDEVYGEDDDNQEGDVPMEDENDDKEKQDDEEMKPPGEENDDEKVKAPAAEEEGWGDEGDAKQEQEFGSEPPEDFSAEPPGDEPASDEPPGDEPPPPADGETSGKPRFVAYADDEGREYFYNLETGETQWERPTEEEGVVVPAPEDEEEGGQEGAEQPVAEDSAADTKEPMQDGGTTEEPPPTEEEEPPPAPKEPERDPKEVALEKAEKALKEPDAILEPDCLANVGELIEQLGGSKGGQLAMSSLVTGFHGLTSICGILSFWLAELKATKSGGGASGGTNERAAAAKAAAEAQKQAQAKAKLFNTTPATPASAADPSASTKKHPLEGPPSDAARGIAGNVIVKMAFERFTTAKADNILNLSSKAEAAFLEEMIDTDRWRRLLIDLSAKHQDSAILMYCLQAISKRGHHREIAKRINQSDYFGVFNSMLASELSVMGKLACAGEGSESGGGSTIASLTEDLKRTCTATSYTYLYATEVLNELVVRAESKKVPAGFRSEAVKRACRKWRKLKEELEQEMIRPATAPVATTAIRSKDDISPLGRKRRVDVALTVNELHQRQRRRLTPADAEKPGAPKNADRQANESVPAAIDSALIHLLKKHSLDVQLDAHLTAKLLQDAGPTSKFKIGRILLDHPTAITALLGMLFKPGQGRTKTPHQVKADCARLLAKAALAAEEVAETAISKQKQAGGGGSGADANKHGNDEEEGEVEEQDGAAILVEEEVVENLLRCSQLCERVEVSVTFTVTDDVSQEKSPSIGRQLCALALKSAVVARGVLFWMMALASGSDFVNSASYATLAPPMLGLARILAVRHPFARPDVLHLASLYLGHRNGELSFQKNQELKEQCLRLFLWLCTLGHAVEVFRLMEKEFQKARDIDSTLLRYFVGGALEVICPPLSIPLVRSMGNMLQTKNAVDALRSSYFDANRQKALTTLIETHFRDAVTELDSSSSTKPTLSSNSNARRRASSRASSKDIGLVSNLLTVYCS